MGTAAELDHTHLWHPFTQQRDWVSEEPLMIEGGEGCELIDAEGNRYLDGVSSLWCNVHGHRHPLIDAAVGDQLGRVAHSTMLGLSHRGAAELAARLVEIARLIAAHEEELAAVIVEPLVQGAAGMVMHPPGYLRAVRDLCDRHGILLICDEVATGFGRTGTMFACEQEGVSPDLLCLAKGLTGGYLPLAATLATERIYESFLGAHDEYKTFFHGHTYTGNPLACAAALGNLDVFEMERTLVRLQPKIRLLTELLAGVEAMSEVAEVRQ